MKHGTRNAYDHHGCRCEPCRAANAAHQRLMNATVQSVRERSRRTAQVAKERNQDRTLPGATRRGWLWTGPEMEIVLAIDPATGQWAHAAVHAAMLTGRTFVAVKTARSKYKRATSSTNLTGCATLGCGIKGADEGSNTTLAVQLCAGQE